MATVFKVPRPTPPGQPNRDADGVAVVVAAVVVVVEAAIVVGVDIQVWLYVLVFMIGFRSRRRVIRVPFRVRT
jgi:hypothetical protein